MDEAASVLQVCQVWFNMKEGRGARKGRLLRRAQTDRAAFDLWIATSQLILLSWTSQNSHWGETCRNPSALLIKKKCMSISRQSVSVCGSVYFWDIRCQHWKCDKLCVHRFVCVFVWVIGLYGLVQLCAFVTECASMFKGVAVVDNWYLMQTNETITDRISGLSLALYLHCMLSGRI